MHESITLQQITNEGTVSSFIVLFLFCVLIILLQELSVEHLIRLKCQDSPPTVQHTAQLTIKAAVYLNAISYLSKYG
jgi:hypothetical protein